MCTNSMVSELEILYKPKIKVKDRVKLKVHQDSVNFLRTIWSPDILLVESFYLVCLDNSGGVIGWKKISSGGVTCTIADPRIIFGIACTHLAPKIIIAHNHPSDSLLPSYQDKELTSKIRSAGLFMDILLVDHIILTEDEHYSFANSGLL